MANILSLETITIIAYSKIILLAVFIFALLIIRLKIYKPWLISLLASLAAAGFYLTLSRPLQKMFWGNNGDEIFIVSWLSQVLFSSPFNDFYYHNLPPFYPPLYFWLTGLVARLFAANAISAAKLGVATTLILWFSGVYLWLKIFYRRIKAGTETTTAANPWLWTILPIIYFSLVDFNDIILKPYETLPALAVAIFAGLMAQSFSEAKWSWKHYVFFGLSAGSLFLTYYFWWIMAIPALFILAALSKQKIRNICRLLIVGAIMLVLSLIYLLPLVLSYWHGLENWQAVFFIPEDFSTFLPWHDLSWRTPLIIAGIMGLIIYYKKKFIKANIVLLLVSYGYQFVNIVFFLLGKRPLQSAKPFLFLATASLAVGAAFLIIEVWKKYILPLSAPKQQAVIFAALIFSLSFWPMAKFIDIPKVRNQLETDLRAPTAYYLAPEIKKAVPDYLSRTWLTSGIPEINAYLPLHYFVAHNSHFSHPAAKYSDRLALVKKLAAASAKEFPAIINKTPIDALLFFKQADSQSYSLYYWVDNYPNGGKEARIDIPKENIKSLNWQKKYENVDWIIYVK